MTSEDGFQIVEQMVQILPNDDCSAQVLVASVPNLTHFLRAAELAPTWRGCPFSLLRQIPHHPLTDKGLDAFLANRRKTSHEDLVAALPETVSRERRGTERKARNSEPRPLMRVLGL